MTRRPFPLTLRWIAIDLSVIKIYFRMSLKFNNLSRRNSVSVLLFKWYSTTTINSVTNRVYLHTRKIHQMCEKKQNGRIMTHNFLTGNRIICLKKILLRFSIDTIEKIDSLLLKKILQVLMIWIDFRALGWKLLILMATIVLWRLICNFLWVFHQI